MKDDTKDDTKNNTKEKKKEGKLFFLSIKKLQYFNQNAILINIF